MRSWEPNWGAYAGQNKTTSVSILYQMAMNDRPPTGDVASTSTIAKPNSRTTPHLNIPASAVRQSAMTEADTTLAYIAGSRGESDNETGNQNSQAWSIADTRNSGSNASHITWEDDEDVVVQEEVQIL